MALFKKRMFSQGLNLKLLITGDRKYIRRESLKRKELTSKTPRISI
jgi:hypothetical protein